jgi:hypothetical protein
LKKKEGVAAASSSFASNGNFMSLKLPAHLNLEFYRDPKQSLFDVQAPLCHVEHDDYGNRIQAVPLKVNADGNIILDFQNAVVLNRAKSDS